MLLSSSYIPQQPLQISPSYTEAQPQQNTMLSFPSSQEGMWNDIDFQLSSMAAPSSTSSASLSRRASTQRPTTTSTLQRGNSMRIVKPAQGGSTHNSPLGLGLGSGFGKGGLGRRMTALGDTTGYRGKRLLEATAAIGQQQQQIKQAQNTQARMRGTTMSSQRPMSWCPTMSSATGMGWNATQQQGEAILRRQAAQYSPESQLRLQQLQQWQQMQLVQQQQRQQQEQQQQQRVQQAQIQQQIQQQHIQQAQMQLLQQEQRAAQEANYFALDLPAQAHPSSQAQTPYFSQQSTPLQFPTYALPLNNYYFNDSYASTPLDMPMGEQGHNTFPAQQDYTMYNNLAVPTSFMAASTTPPTPETFPFQDSFQPQYVSTTESPFSLDTTEDDGEVLVGLGLYSAPDKATPKQIVEPHIVEMYARAGVPIINTEEKAGKGLKLEETWEPPASDDGEKSEEDNDAEGEEEEEEEEEQNQDDLSHMSMGANAVGQMGPPVGWL